MFANSAIVVFGTLRVNNVQHISFKIQNVVQSNGVECLAYVQGIEFLNNACKVAVTPG